MNNNRIIWIAASLVLIGAIGSTAAANTTSVRVSVVPTIVGATFAQTNISVVIPTYNWFGYSYHAQADQGPGIVTAEYWSVAYVGNGWYSLSGVRWQ